MTIASLLAAFIFGSALFVDGFSVQVQQFQQQRKHVTSSISIHDETVLTRQCKQRYNTVLQMVDESKEEVKAEEDATTTDESSNVPSDDATDEENKEEEKDETALIKEEIAKLELDIKNKRRTLSYYNDLADDYTKTGYARKVAEMENMRRARSMLASSNKFTATANTLGEFLPVVETLETLRDKYGDDSFGKQYSAVTGAVKSAFKALGVEEYTVNVGDTIDNSRIIVVDSQHSTEYAKGAVIEVLQPGIELKGNTVRPTKVIASLGAEEKEEEAAASSETADAVASADDNVEA